MHNTEFHRLAEQVAFELGNLGIAVEATADPVGFLGHVLTAMRTAAATSTILARRRERDAEQQASVAMSLADPHFALLGGSRAPAPPRPRCVRPTWAASAVKRLIRGR